MRNSLRTLLILAVVTISQPTHSTPPIVSMQTPAPDVLNISPVPLPPGAVARFGQGSLDHVEISPDNKYIAVGGSIGVVVYDSDTFKPIWTARTGTIFGMSWSPNSQLLAASAGGTGILIWNGLNGRWLYRLTGYGAVNLEWTPDSKRLALSGDAIWEVGSAHPIRLDRTDDGEYKHYGILATDGLLSPNGQIIATTYTIGSPDANTPEGVVIIWDVLTGTQKRILSIKRYNFSGDVLWFPDDKHLLVRLDNGFTEWDITTGRQVNTPFAINRDFGPNTYWIGPIYATPQGKFVAWERKGEDRARLVDIQTGDLVYQEFENESTEYISPGFKMVATYNASDNEIIFRQFPDGAVIARLWNIREVAALSEDWKTLVAWHEFSQDTLNVWKVPSGDIGIPLATKSAPLHDVAWSPDGSQIATIDENGNVVIRDSHSDAIDFAYESSGTASSSTPARIAYSRDGKRLATLENGNLTVQSIATNLNFTLTLTLGESPSWDRMVWSPDTTHIALLNDKGELAVIDLATGRVQRPDEITGDSQHIFVLYGVAWSPDGTKIAVGSLNGKVNIRDAIRLKITSTLTYNGGNKSAPEQEDSIQEDSVLDIAFSPDGRSLAAVVYASGHQYLAIWDLQSGNVRASQISDGFRTAISLVWSPDGKKLAVGIGSPWFGMGWSPANQGPIIIFSAQTGRQLTVLYGHSSDVEGVAFSPDGKQLASASLDGTVLIWDISGL